MKLNIFKKTIFALCTLCGEVECEKKKVYAPDYYKGWGWDIRCDKCRKAEKIKEQRWQENYYKKERKEEKEKKKKWIKERNELLE